MVAQSQLYSFQSERLDIYAYFSDSVNKPPQVSQNGAEIKTKELSECELNEPQADSNVNSMNLKLNILSHADGTQHKECWLGGN